MVDQQTIDQWKKQYGKIFQIEEFIFRGISVGEYKYISSLTLNSAEIEESIAHAAILYPDDLNFDDLPAGVISSIAEQVTNISGFGDPKVIRSILQEKRDELNNVFTLMKALVLSAMPAYTEEYLDDLAIPVLLGKVVLAEEILKIHQTTVVGETVKLDLLDPEEEAAKKQKAAAKHDATKLPGQAGYNDPIADKLRRATS